MSKSPVNSDVGEESSLQIDTDINKSAEPVYFFSDEGDRIIIRKNALSRERRMMFEELLYLNHYRSRVSNLKNEPEGGVIIEVWGGDPEHEEKIEFWGNAFEREVRLFVIDYEMYHRSPRNGPNDRIRKPTEVVQPLSKKPKEKKTTNNKVTKKKAPVKRATNKKAALEFEDDRKAKYFQDKKTSAMSRAKRAMDRAAK